MIDRKQLQVDRMMKKASRRVNRARLEPSSRNNALICGPPASGKTKYVREHSGQFDFVFDYDALLSAMTLRDRNYAPEKSIELLMALRDRYIERAAADHQSRFWLISASPDDNRRNLMAAKMGAQIIYIATPAETCIERIKEDDGRALELDKWKELVNDWWGGFNPKIGEMVIN